MKQHGVPGRLDPSVMKSMSGTVQAQLRSALRYLNLTDDTDVPQESLYQLVGASGEDQKKLLVDLLVQAYPFLLGPQANFDLSKATPSQFHEKFRDTGLGGDTIRKAEGFFLQLAQEAGVPVGKHITLGRTTVEKSRKPSVRNGKNSPQISKQPTATVEDGGSQTGVNEQQSTSRPNWKEMMIQSLLDKFPEFRPDWESETQQKWFDGFSNLMNVLAEHQSEKRFDNQ